MPAVYGRAAVQPDTETAVRSRAGNYWPTRDLRGSLLKGKHSGLAGQAELGGVGVSRPWSLRQR
jgi:hypothetical protein